jgi:hypothetical protein
MPLTVTLPTASWTQTDPSNDVWQLDLEDGTQEFIALPHPPYVEKQTAGLGAAWGARIERNGTLSNWFTLQFMGQTARGVEVALRRGLASERSRRSFRNAEQACSRPELPVCRAHAIMWALLDGDGAFQGPGTRTVLSNRPLSIGLKVTDRGVPTSAPDLTLTFEDGLSPTQLKLTLARP